MRSRRDAAATACAKPAEKDYKLSDGAGLYLLVRPNGSKLWRFNYVHHGKHRTLAFGTLLRVTNLANGRAVTVEVTDRGPRIKSRVIDISLAAARALHMQNKGITRVKLEAFREDQPGGGLTGMTAFPGSEAR